MPTKIRLQRKGKKGQPFYHLVVADGRAPRDGRFIERLGTYNPMTHPATIEINFDRSLYWVQVGAQPTDTARSILSNKGVMLKHHLLKGVKKGALTEEQVEEKFQEWLKEKDAKLEQSKKDADLSDKEKRKQQLEAERKINESRAEEIAKKRAKENLKMEEKKAEVDAPPAGEIATPEEAKPDEETKAPEVKAEEKVSEEKASEEKASEEKAEETGKEE
ncbi:MAG: 30S ribosomal protein S16 [Bacteroidia bacterium]|nr:MAG: 30S ribosomal protein S16 [Bacteroidia bacterium]